MEENISEKREKEAPETNAKEPVSEESLLNGEKRERPEKRDRNEDSISIKASSESNSLQDMSSLKTNKRKRLSQDRVGQLEDLIALDDKDASSWLKLIMEYKDKNKIEEARSVYERFLKVFPTAAQQWIDYADMELTNNEFIRVETIFSRCLRSVLSVDLWKFYLDYIRRVNNVSTGGAQARSVISQAYEFVLAHVGIDKDCGSIWSDYINFIKTAEIIFSHILFLK
ncbi:hypothetical protein MERGE_003069 [Pneumocystis wakefieldiae]|uniref:mRNA 3'-end-processing protein RNA14 n=1 Tax=Pneumocystis wakefieldiae TaxID=38082 RepID=A0A899G158_9ASCO|nr:hypothetical protein MERGE_003069 [Pneumocystis wakefieldiae]